MMPNKPVTRSAVIEFSRTLPGFPRIVSDILTTLDDPESSTEQLVGHIAHDPVIAARVLSLANAAANRSGRHSAVGDLYTAASLIGTNRVREMTLLSSVADFVDNFGSSGLSKTFWHHSIAVGVCCEELVQHSGANVPSNTALIAGLLHDVGQLLLYRYAPDTFATCWEQALLHDTSIEEVECELFGIDHAAVGAWLTEHWALPGNITAAVRNHHDPAAGLDDPLVPLLHVAEVLANALDLTGRPENRVTRISAAACHKLGLVWDGEIRPLFGRMEARSRHANAMF
jgi:putative nucleotidyltransferase with HDIG domain